MHDLNPPGFQDFAEDSAAGVDEIFIARFREQKLADEFAEKFRYAVEQCGGGAAAAPDTRM